MTKTIENRMIIELKSGSRFRVEAVLPNREHVILKNCATGRHRQLKKTDYYLIENIHG